MVLKFFHVLFSKKCPTPVSTCHLLWPTAKELTVIIAEGCPPAERTENKKHREAREVNGPNRYMFKLNSSTPQFKLFSSLLLYFEGVLLFQGSSAHLFKHDWTNLMSLQASGSSHPWCWVANTGAFHGFKCSATGQSEAAALLLQCIYLVCLLLI